MTRDAITAADVLAAIRQVQEEDLRNIGDDAIRGRNEQRARTTRIYFIHELLKQTDTFRAIMAEAGNPGLKRADRTTVQPSGLFTWLRAQTIPGGHFWPVAIEEPPPLTKWPEPKLIVLTPDGEWWRAGHTPATSQEAEVYGLIERLDPQSLNDPDRYSSIGGNVLNDGIDKAVLFSMAELIDEWGVEPSGFRDAAVDSDQK